MIAFRIKITGKVQGVFFRDSTKRKADELGIFGWVRNEPDGTVLVEVEGEEEKMEEFKQWCNIGSTASRVDGVAVEGIPIQGFSSFEVIF